MSDDKDLLDYLLIYSFLFLNEKVSNGNQVPKFSITNDISEVYSLPRNYECINDQKPLRVIINIDALQEDIEITDVKIQKEILEELIIATLSNS
ncbi:9439_t:CDS:2, partial [Funneliformis geosporum]